jgi:hypothetical protein
MQAFKLAVTCVATLRKAQVTLRYAKLHNWSISQPRTAHQVLLGTSSEGELIGGTCGAVMKDGHFIQNVNLKV